jgi:HlyD family secretion protein
MTESDRPSRPWLRPALWTLIGVGVVAALVLAFLPQPVPVDLALVREGALEVAVEEDGRTRVRVRTVIVAPVAGILEAPEVEPGDIVPAGGGLLRILGPESPLSDPRTEAQLRVRLEGARLGVERALALSEAATAGVTEAREGLRAQEVLLEGGSGSASAVSRARALLLAREAEARSQALMVELARGEVRDLELALAPGRSGAGAGGGGEGAGSGAAALELRAPADGIVLRRFRDGGGAVFPGEPLLEFGDPSELEVVVDLLSAQAVRITPGAPATLRGWGGDAVLEARVRRVDPAGFTRFSALGIEEQRVSVILEPTGAGWPELGDGFRVDARIVVDRIESTRTVPSGAVFRVGESWAVFVAGPRRIELRVVEIGERTPADVEIRSGLDVGTPVVVYPSDRVADGLRYRVRREAR